MRPYIPFVHSDNDINYLLKYFPKVRTVRVQLTDTKVIKTLIAKKYQIWLDSSFDIFEQWPLTGDGFDEFNNKYNILHKLLINKSLNKEFKKNLRGELTKYLEQVIEHNYHFLSLPQLPYTIKKNMIPLNRILINSSIDILSKVNKKGKYILPLVVSHQDIINKKPERDKLVKFALECCKKYPIYGIWVVDKSLVDSSGSDTLKKRFSNLIQFHESLRNQLSDEIKIVAGPYWAFNLILWSRELIDNVIIGLGNGYQYFSPGHVIRPSKSKIVLPSLYRYAFVNSELEQWLIDIINNSDKKNKSIIELNNLLKRFNNFYEKPIARDQIAQFYSIWLDDLLALPVSGRSLALYQMFSSAFVFGKDISLPLPKSESPARAPEKVAQQYILNCL